METARGLIDYMSMKIEISIEEYKIIRDALMERPAKEVFPLIAKLDSEVIEQNKKEMPKMAEAVKDGRK